MPITTTFDGTGMTLRQKLAVGAEILCQTCPTCGGSGSGSASSAGGPLRNCCNETGVLVSALFSYLLTGCDTCLAACASGTGGGIEPGACDGIGSEYTFPEDAAIGVASQGGIASYVKDCSGGLSGPGVSVVLCCYELDNGTSFYQVNATVAWAGGGAAFTYKYRCKLFDVASCSPFLAQKDALAPFETIIVGTPCVCASTPLLSFVLSGAY